MLGWQARASEPVYQKTAFLRRKVMRLMQAAFVDAEVIEVVFEKLGCEGIRIGWENAVKKSTRPQLLEALKILRGYESGERSENNSTRRFYFKSRQH